MLTKLKKIVKEIEEFEQDRIFWLRLSGFICFIVSTMIIMWNIIITEHMRWVFESFGMLVAVCWWYWIMKLVRSNIKQRRIITDMLKVVLTDSNSLKDDNKNNKDIDKTE